MDEGNCPAVGSSGNILDFCETALKISGPVPLVQEVGLRLPAGSLATAVTGVTLGPPGATSLVAIVGTADGDIIKGVLWSGGGQDAILVDTFKAADNERLERTLSEMLCYIRGGPCHYTGREMKDLHKDMGVQVFQLNAQIEDLQKAMAEEHVPVWAQNKLLAKLAPLERLIVVR